MSLQLRHMSTIGKKLVKQQCLPHMWHNMVNFDPLAAEIHWRVWGTPAHFSGFCVLAALLHGTLVVAISQTLRRWTEGATYIRQGGHHIGHWPTFILVIFIFFSTIFTPPTVKHHLSNDTCLEDKRENYLNCSVLCCIWQLCTVVCTQNEQLLKMNVGLVLGFVFVHLFRFNSLCVFLV